MRAGSSEAGGSPPVGARTIRGDTGPAERSDEVRGATVDRVRRDPPPLWPSAAARARELARTLGKPYVALAAARVGAAHVADRLEHALLAIEGRRGVLGPAHERHAEHSAARNREVWTNYDWQTKGEEWSASPEWKAALVAEVLEPYMPEGGTILEIGPGAGRWSEVLRNRAAKLIVVDVAERALELTRERLGADGDVTYVRSSGSTLPGVPDSSVDAVWSFDVFVHIAPPDVASYLAEIGRVLRPGGTAVIHHSGERDPRFWRAPMSARLFAGLARERGFEVERQFSTWGGGRFAVSVEGDSIAVLCRSVRKVERRSFRRGRSG
jgi:ubiquinone/menaquinone biosynthesis C-methylase UbiE